jgi:polysaccharide export outer membrane protein
MLKSRLGVLMMGLVCLGGLTLGQNRRQDAAPPPAPAKVEAPSTVVADPNGIAQAIDPRAYVIGAEDIIRVIVFQNADFSGIHVVRPDGKITLPFVGDVQAEGLTPERLRAQLTQAIKTYIEMPEVTVSIQQVNSKSFRIEGWVNRPSRYPLVTPIRVYEAIADAGGFREFANTKHVIIMRGAKRIEFDADSYRKGKKMEQNIFVENGDIILVKDN